VASRLSLFPAELRRRKVYHVAAVYATVGVAICLGVPDLFSAFDLPASAARLVIVLIAVGFSIALVLAWAYEIRPEEPGTMGRTPEGVREVAQPGQRKRIAVLPFDNLSGDPENEYFSDGVTEGILTHLSRVGDLHVTSRTSVMAYEGTWKQIREIAGELGVGTVLEGTVRRGGNRVRVSAQLMGAWTDRHVWADTFDRDLEDIFEVRSTIAETIAHSLKAKLSTTWRPPQRSGPPSFPGSGASRFWPIPLKATLASRPSIAGSSNPIPEIASLNPPPSTLLHPRLP
jgi:TolB-like protein